MSIPFAETRPRAHPIVLASYLFAATLPLACGAVSASAADMPMHDMPMKAAVAPAAPPYQWTGCYIGLNGGGGASGTNVTTAVGAGGYLVGLDPGEVNNDGTGSVNASNFLGGGQVGCNWQTGTIVVGLEGDFDYFHANSNFFNDTNTTGFFNTEFFVDLKPKEQWRPVFHENKDELIAAMQRELDKIPGVVWGFSQPIEDNMEEAVSGVKGALATKIYGDDLKVLEEKSDEIATVMRHINGIEDLGVFRVLGQPNLNITVNRAAAARYQVNVADVQDAIQTAVGGNALTQVLQGEARYDLTLRYLPEYRDTQEAIENVRLQSASGERVSLQQLCNISVTDGASEIYREGNRRYVAIKYSVRGRDLGSTVEEAIKKVDEQVKLPTGYSLDWEGEYESQKRANQRLLIVLPITILLIFVILYTMFKSFKWALLILANIAIAPIGGLLALLLTGTNFSVSSGVGFLALFGVSVQTGVIMLEYINQLRARRYSIEDAAVEGAVLRLRPIMMTMLVATLGLLPAALSHAIGSDSQRPFAIVIVGGLSVTLVLSIFVLPTLYVWMAGNRDTLPAVDREFDEED